MASLLESFVNYLLPSMGNLFGGGQTTNPRDFGPVASGDTYGQMLSGTNSGGGGLDLPWGDMISGLGQAGLEGWMTYNNAQAGREDDRIKRDWLAEQAGLNRQSEMDQLMATLSQREQMAKLEAAMTAQAIKQRAAEAASQAALGAGQLGNNAFQNFITAAQRPLLR